MITAEVRGSDGCSEQFALVLSGGAKLGAEDAAGVFASWLGENAKSGDLSGPVLGSTRLAGFVSPSTLLIRVQHGQAARTLRHVWTQRKLRPPKHYNIKQFASVSGMRLCAVPQCPASVPPEFGVSGASFVSLPDAVGAAVARMNRNGRPATLDSIRRQLSREHKHQAPPRPDVLFGVLCALVAEGSLYCTGEHYFVATPIALLCHQTIPAAPYYAAPAPPKQSNGMCSRECQTGASIVDAPGTVQQMVKNAAQTNQMHTASSETQTKTQTNPKEKGGFFARLFTKRSEKSRERSTPMPKSSTADSRLAENSQSVPATQPQLGTFNAQFPPLEWLHDPNMQPQHNTHTRTKERQFQSSSKQHRSNERFRAPQRYCLFPENLVGNTPVAKEKHREQAALYGSRFQRYLSSSSECLQYLGPVDPPTAFRGWADAEGMLLEDPRSSSNRRSSSHRRRSKHNRAKHPHQQSTPLAQRGTTTDDNTDEGEDQATPKAHQPTKTSTPNARTVKEKAIPTAPAPSSLRPESAGDSALSTSPQVTSESAAGGPASTKYSSWSGSEMDGGRGSGGLDEHTYANVRDGAMDNDRTYVNLQHNNSASRTHFENITNLPTMIEDLSLNESGLDSSMNVEIDEPVQLGHPYVSSV